MTTQFLLLQRIQAMLRGVILTRRQADDLIAFINSRVRTRNAA